MGRTIKLLLLYFAYQLAFFGVLVGVYMLKNGVMEMPDVSGSEYMSVIMWAQFLSTLSIGLHVILGKYVSVDVFKLKIPNKWSILIAFDGIERAAPAIKTAQKPKYQEVQQSKQNR